MVSFNWKGLDGTKLLSHMEPLGDYNAGNSPLAIFKSEDRYSEKDICDRGRIFLLFQRVRDILRAAIRTSEVEIRQNKSRRISQDCVIGWQKCARLFSLFLLSATANRGLYADAGFNGKFRIRKCTAHLRRCDICIHDEDINQYYYDYIDLFFIMTILDKESDRYKEIDKALKQSYKIYKKQGAAAARVGKPTHSRSEIKIVFPIFLTV